MNNELYIGGKEYQIRNGLVRLLRLRNEFIDDVSDPQSVVSEIRTRVLPVDLLTFLQLPPDSVPKFSYRMHWDNLAVLQISTYEHWLKGQIHPNTRNKIRKAEKKGVVIRLEPFTDYLAAGMVELFNESAVRRGRRYEYYGWDLEKVREGWATELERSVFLVARYEETFIGFIKLVVGDHLARTSGTIAKEAHRDKAPMSALFARSVELCAERGIPQLIYGHFTYGARGEDSLTDFKRNHGFQKVTVPRYYVPLSTRGCIGLSLGLHRSVSDLIPEPALRFLLQLRARWHHTVTRH